MSTPSVTWHPHVTHDAVDPTFGNRFWELVWKTAAVTSLVFFTALALVTVAYAAMLNPLYVPPIIAGVLAITLPTALYVFGYCMDKAAHYDRHLKLNNSILTKISGLPTNATELRTLVENLGVDTRTLSDQDLTTITPAIARAQVMGELAEKSRVSLEQRKQKGTFICTIDEKEVTVPVAQTARLSEIDPANATALQTQYKISDWYISALGEEEMLELCRRIAFAYSLHVLQSPHDARSSTDFCQTYLFNRHDRLRVISRERGDPLADIFVKTKGVAPQSYTIDQLKQLSTAEIAERLFGLTLAAPKSDDLDDVI